MDITAFEQKTGIKFNNPDIFWQAMTHRSYLNENPGAAKEDNERLEFLGDAVLELAATEYLYANYPEPEGVLTSWRSALVNAKMLAKIAHDFGLNDYVRLSRGEANGGERARQYILANAFEALIGAIYLDQGYEATADFVEKYVLKELPDIIKHKLYHDPKSLFQEKAQEIAGITPMYEVVKEWGPDHHKTFVVGVYLGQELVATGQGSSKQEAQEKAAEEGLKKKGW